MAANSFDAIVLGVGSMGATACFELARKGFRVLGLDQFSIPHDNGSHSGQSRIIRKAYFEHPDYVPLLQKAYDNWERLEQLTGTQVYFKTGILYAGQPEHPIIEGVKTSSHQHKIEIEEITADGIAQRFPQFSLPGDYIALFEPGAGWLLPAKAIALFADEAEKHGATINTGERIINWTKEGDHIKVLTDRNSYNCEKLIITSGAWTGKLVPELHASLRITRQVVVWVMPKEPANFSLANFPCWMITDDGLKGVYYGFPYLGEEQFGKPAGLKFALHYPATETDPDHVNRQITNEEVNAITAGLRNYLPAASSPVVAASTCLYANSPDENFIIDFLPGFEKQVTIACGFSGHGFKFASAIGEILADMAMNGQTNLSIDFLRLARFET